MDKILVSVILPCYNAERYIGVAVSSILNQTHSHLELFVINDASTDDSLEVLSRFSDKRLTVINNDKNMGYPTSMNIGIARAKGKYIARMDADDFSMPERLKIQVALHESHPTCAFVSSKRGLLTPFGKAHTLDAVITDDSYFEETWEDLFNGIRTFTDAACLVRKDYIESVGGYSTYMRTGMDVDLWFRLMEFTKSNVIVISKLLFFRRLLPNSISFSSETNNDLVREKASLRHLKKTYKTSSTYKPKRVILKNHIRSLSTIAIHCFLTKDMKGCFLFMKKALSYRKFLWSSVFLNIAKKWYHYRTKIKMIKVSTTNLVV